VKAEGIFGPKREVQADGGTLFVKSFMIMFITKYNFHQSVTARRSGLVARTLPSRYERKRKIRAVTCTCGYVLHFGPALPGAYFYSSKFISL